MTRDPLNVTLADVLRLADALDGNPHLRFRKFAGGVWKAEVVLPRPEGSPTLAEALRTAGAYVLAELAVIDREGPFRKLIQVFESARPLDDEEREVANRICEVTRLPILATDARVEADYVDAHGSMRSKQVFALPGKSDGRLQALREVLRAVRLDHCECEEKSDANGTDGRQGVVQGAAEGRDDTRRDLDPECAERP